MSLVFVARLRAKPAVYEDNERLRSTRNHGKGSSCFSGGEECMSQADHGIALFGDVFMCIPPAAFKHI